MYFSPRRDTFAFYRFERKENGWRYIGHQIFSDLDSIMKGADDYRDVPKKCELVDWSTIRMTMNSGAIRTLTVDQDGQFMENGQPYVYTDKKTIRSPEFARPQEHAKAYYKGSIDRYFDPRDEDGVPLDRIAELMERAKQAQSSSAQHSVLPSSPDQVQTPPIIAGHNTSKTGSNLFSMRNLLWFSLVIILAGLLALTKKKRNQL